jgi:hypothetical protein
VADLVSRKPKPHGHDESPADNPKTIALEYKPALEEEHPGIEAATVNLSVDSGPEAQLEDSLGVSDPDMRDAATTAPAATEATAVSVGDDEAASPVSTQRVEETPVASPEAEPSKTTIKAAPTLRKRSAPIMGPEVLISAASEEAPVMVAGPRSLIKEMSDLDGEVSALRRQLSKKLVEQNAQLRRMLARFDGR